MSRLAIAGGSPVRTKQFSSWPVFDQSEEDAVLRVLRGGQWWQNSCGEATADAPKSEAGRFARAFAARHGVKYGIACSNGSIAIEVALKALKIGCGDEVIVPPYTFIATATGPLNVNAIPIFADIDKDTLNISPPAVERAITSRTRAIIPVHFAGAAVDIDAIWAIARKHGLSVIEDAAHAHGGAWNGKGLGSLGDLATFSFQASKNMTAGEGGVIITNDEALALLCESYVWGGRKQGRPWYEHHRLGWNARLTEMQAAILLEQLKRLDDQVNRRMKNGLYLSSHLQRIPGVHPLRVPEFVTTHPFHIYIFRFDAKEFGLSRSRFLAALAQEGIPCSSGYAHPLYKNPVFLNREFNSCQTSSYPDYARFESACTEAENACSEVVWLEQRLLLGTEKDMDDIVSAVGKIWECRHELSADY